MDDFEDTPTEPWTRTTLYRLRSRMHELEAGDDGAYPDLQLDDLRECLEAFARAVTPITSRKG